MEIVLLGSGNVATHLGKAFKMAGLNIAQVWSPTLEHAAELADRVAAKAISDLSDIDDSADIYVMAVKDDAIADLAGKLKLADKLLIHTSGTTDIQALAPASSKYGVLYPLQTFSKSKALDFRTVPIAIEGNSDEATDLIRGLADRLSENVSVLSSEQRKTLHIAAVFACNFANHLFAIGNQLLKEQSLDFNMIRPLIAETADKIRLNYPQDVQTGPAVRNDLLTIQTHIEMLSNKPEWKEIYQRLSQSIVNLQEQSGA